MNILYRLPPPASSRRPLPTIIKRTTFFTPSSPYRLLLAPFYNFNMNNFFHTVFPLFRLPPAPSYNLTCMHPHEHCYYTSTSYNFIHIMQLAIYTYKVTHSQAPPVLGGCVSIYIHTHQYTYKRLYENNNRRRCFIIPINVLLLSVHYITRMIN